MCAFFFYISTEIPTNAMLCHTIPYHILLEITFPPLTALLGDSPLLLSASRYLQLDATKGRVSLRACCQEQLSTHRMIDITLLHPRLGKEPRIFRISIYVRRGVLVIGPAMNCTVLYRKKKKKESKERHSRHLEEYSYNFAFSLMPPSSSFMRLSAVA